jgi:predicted dehydrogenase
MVYRAALIGCGKIGSEFDDNPRVKGVYSHAGAYTSCSKTELSAVCDADPNKLSRCAEKWNVAGTFRDAHEMLAETRPDIVSICTPDSTHYELLRAALSTPGVRAVFAEKPLALELDQANEIVEEADRCGVLLAVNYTRRYSNSYVELRQFLDSGGIGEILAVSGFYTKGIIHNGSHWIDLVRFLLGEMIEFRGISSRREASPDPTLDGLIEFAGGVEGYLHGCTFNDEVSLFEMEIVGTRGRVSITDSGRTITFSELAENPHHAGYKTFVKTREIDGGLSYALLNAVDDLVHALTTGGRPRCDGRDATAALRIACALRDSAPSATPVSLSEN